MKFSILVLLMLVSLLSSQVFGSSEFRQNFRTSAHDPEVLKLIGIEGGCQVDRGPNGLTIRIPPGGRNHGPVGLSFRPIVRGDFEITASYELAKAGPPTGGYGAGLGLVIETDSRDGQSITMERTALPIEGQRFTSTHIFTNDFGEKQYRPERSKTNSTSGKLRLARKGSSIEASYAEGEGETRLLRRVEIGTDDVIVIRLACYTGSSDCGVIATIKDLEFRSDELISRAADEVLAGRRSNKWRVWWKLVVLINLILIMALATWRWRSLISRNSTKVRIRGTQRRTPKIAIILILAAVTVVSAEEHRRAIETNYVHSDELIWTTLSYYYRLALQGDFDHPLWSGFDGIDQPHVAQILIGLGLHQARQPVPMIPTSDNSWVDKPLPSGPLLRAARMPSTLLGVAISPMICLIAVLATGRWLAGLAAGLLYAIHPLANLCQARAMSDGPLMFFGIAAILVLSWTCRRDDAGARKSLFGKRGMSLMALGPVLLAMAVGSKLTGVFMSATAFFTLGIVTAWGLMMRGPGRRGWATESLTYLAIFVTLTATWTILVNPTLYPDPIRRSRQMFDHRWATGQGQRASHPEWGVYTISDRLQAFYERVVADGMGRAAIPLLILSGIGLCGMTAGEVMRARRGHPPSPAMVVLVWTAVCFGVMLPTLPLNWERYYLPLLPIWAICVGAGLTTLVVGLRRLIYGLTSNRAISTEKVMT